MKNPFESYRQLERVSKADAARNFGVSRAMWDKYETMHANPPLYLMFALSKYFGSRIDDVFDYVMKRELAALLARRDRLKKRGGRKHHESTEH